MGLLLFAAGLLLSACAAPAASVVTPTPLAEPSALIVTTPTSQPGPPTTPLPTRAAFGPGQRLPYVTQTGDYVAALAAHFNTTPEEVLAANPGLPLTTTLPVGLRLEIPSYYFPLGGPVNPILPDSEFVYGPAQSGFDLAAYIEAQPGFLKSLSAFVNKKQRSAAGTVAYVAAQYSLNPKLLLALMEWRSGALSNPNASPEARANPFGQLPASAARDWYLQTLWVAEQLSVGYYGWRTGELTTILLEGDYTARVDMYQNAGTVGVQYLLAQMLTRDEFGHAAGPDGFAKIYAGLWGDPWAAVQEVLPGGLVQPELALPFAPRQSWSFTGGPHPAWGQRVPWAALDFAPSGVSGCNATANSALAVAPGVVARAEDSTVMLDLDGDGDERTGWVIFYFHIAAQDMVAAGAVLKTGDPIGHPSCEGGTATGTHVHIARRYNGEWLLADGILPFDLGGWVAQRGAAAYQGRLTRLGAWVEASTASTAANRVYWVTP